MTNQPNYSEIWLVRFPFSDLTSTKLRPALVIARHRQELIILGIFSKIPSGNLRDTWVLLPDNYPDRTYASTLWIGATTEGLPLQDPKYGSAFRKSCLSFSKPD